MCQVRAELITLHQEMHAVPTSEELLAFHEEHDRLGADERLHPLLLCVGCTAAGGSEGCQCGCGC